MQRYSPPKEVVAVVVGGGGGGYCRHKSKHGVVREWQEHAVNPERKALHTLMHPRVHLVLLFSWWVSYPCLSSTVSSLGTDTELLSLPSPSPPPSSPQAQHSDWYL